MDLTGGLNMYLLLNGESEGRYKNGDSPYGRKVKYLDYNGRDSDIEYARECGLVKDQIYTVKEVYVERSSSEVELLEVEGKFNTVMFEDVEIEKADKGDDLYGSKD